MLLTLPVWDYLVLNATFNNISVISWQSVLLVVSTWRTDLHSLGHALSESKSLIYVTIFRRKDKGVSNYIMIE
jgi:hypothetical protein